MVAHSPIVLRALCAAALLSCILAQGPPAPAGSTLPPHQQGAASNNPPPSNPQQQLMEAYQQLLSQNPGPAGNDMNALLQHRAAAISQMLQTGSLPCPPAQVLPYITAHLEHCAQGSGPAPQGPKMSMPGLKAFFAPPPILPQNPVVFPKLAPLMQNFPSLAGLANAFQPRYRRSPKFGAGPDQSDSHPDHQEGPKQEQPQSHGNNKGGHVKPIGA